MINQAIIDENDLIIEKHLVQQLTSPILDPAEYQTVSPKCDTSILFVESKKNAVGDTVQEYYRRNEHSENTAESSSYLVSSAQPGALVGDTCIAYLALTQVQKDISYSLCCETRRQNEQTNRQAITHKRKNTITTGGKNKPHLSFYNHIRKNICISVQIDPTRETTVTQSLRYSPHYDHPAGAPV